MRNEDSFLRRAYYGGHTDAKEGSTSRRPRKSMSGLLRDELTEPGRGLKISTGFQARLESNMSNRVESKRKFW